MQEATDFLRSDHLVIEPRSRWPKSLVGSIADKYPAAIERYENGRPKIIIPEHLRTEEGRVLCMYGDGGWGDHVARGKYESGRFGDVLVEAAANLIRNKWKPEPAPEWVTCVPSKTHPELVQDFAQRLAAKLDLPFASALRKTRNTEQQKVMQNSAAQVRNLIGVFEVREVALEEAATGPQRLPGSELMQRFRERIKASMGNIVQLPPLPVLLVDDVVDSGWTLTMAGLLLREHGSGPVYLFALARASLRGS